MFNFSKFSFAALLSVSLYAILLLERDVALYFAGEDGIIENIGALSFFCAGIIFAKIYINDVEGNNFYYFSMKRNVFFLLLAMAFIFAAGEEISWGQRIFNFDTPDYWKKLNKQNEFNLHNTLFFDGNAADGGSKKGLYAYTSLTKLFALFWLVYCVIIPILAMLSPATKRFIAKINLPLVPLNIGIFFLFSYITLKTINEILTYHHLLQVYGRLFVETRETIEGILFLIVSLYFFSTTKTSKMESEAAGHL